MNFPISAQGNYMLRGQKQRELRLQQGLPSKGKTLNDKIRQRMILKQYCFKNKNILILIQIFIPAVAKNGIPCVRKHIYIYIYNL